LAFVSLAAFGAAESDTELAVMRQGRVSDGERECIAWTRRVEFGGRFHRPPGARDRKHLSPQLLAFAKAVVPDRTPLSVASPTGAIHAAAY